MESLKPKIDFNKKYITENVIEYRFLRINGLKKFAFEDFMAISNREGDDKFAEEQQDFANAMTRALRDSEEIFKAYFWECPPIRNDSVSEQFKFVITEAAALANIKEDYCDFENHFKGKENKLVCSFKNLSGDATLVVPIPKEGKDFAQLARFNREADNETKRKFWIEVADKLRESLKDNKPKWLSTSGLGVYYLHVRIDNTPKYYQYQPYKKAAQ